MKYTPKEVSRYIQSNTDHAEIIANIKAEKITDVIISSDLDDELRPSNEQKVSLIADIIDKTNIFCLDTEKFHLDDNIEPIADALKYNTSLLNLNLTFGIKTGFKRTGPITETLKINNTLESLHITADFTGLDETKLITEALVINKGLKTLKLGGAIDVEGLRFILESPKMSTILQYLDIRGSGIKLEGAQLITDFLKAGSNLKTLYFGGNPIGLEGAKLFADVLKANCALEDLIIGHDDLEPEGLSLLMESLKTNSNMLSIYYGSDSPSGEEGGKAVIECLKKNRAITSIVYNNEEISRETKDLISRYIDNNKQGYKELGKFIPHNEQEILKGVCGKLSNLKLYVAPNQKAGITPITPPTIGGLLTLLFKVNVSAISHYSYDYESNDKLADLSLVNNLKLLIARNYFEISGICKKFDDDNSLNKDNLLLSLSKDLILMTYDIPIAVYPKPVEDSVEAAGDLEHADNN